MNVWLFRAVAFVVLVFGGLCVNYTTDHGASHHREWAQEHGFPEPNPWIYDAGLVLTIVGAGAVGFSLARRREAR